MELNTEQIASQICENIKSREDRCIDNAIGNLNSSDQADDIKRVCHALRETGVDAKVQNINGMYFLTIRETNDEQAKAKAKKRDFALQRWHCHTR